MRANRAGEPTPSCRDGMVWCLVRRKQLIVTSPIDAYGRSRMVSADIIHCTTNTRDKPHDNRIYATNSRPVPADGRILELQP